MLSVVIVCAFFILWVSHWFCYFLVRGLWYLYLLVDFLLTLVALRFLDHPSHSLSSLFRCLLCPAIVSTLQLVQRYVVSKLCWHCVGTLHVALHVTVVKAIEAI